MPASQIPFANDADSDPIDLPRLRRRVYWQRTRTLTAWSLAVGFCVTVLVIFFARQLTQLTLFGWPVSFFMAAQGLILVYLGIVVYYAIAMREYDKLMTMDAALDEGAEGNHGG